MERSDCALSLDRVLAMFSCTKDDAIRYTNSIHESCGWMQSIRFEAVCKRMVAEMAPGRRPVPAQFTKLYHEMSSDLGWAAHDAVEKPPCESCGGIGFIYVRLRNVEDGREGDHVRPCPRCRRDHPLVNAPTKKGWIEVS